MSSDLTWLLTRSNSSFLVKRNGLRLSSEPGNLYNLHSLKYSGLAPTRTVAIAAAPSGKGVQVTTRKTRLAPSKIAKSKQVTVIAKPARTTAKSVRGLVQGYRPDLVKVFFIQKS